LVPSEPFGNDGGASTKPPRKSVGERSRLIRCGACRLDPPANGGRYRNELSRQLPWPTKLSKTSGPCRFEGRRGLCHPQPMNFDEAAAVVTALDAPFVIDEITVRGATTRIFRNCPPTLRDVYTPNREREGVFLVYEEERWTFVESMVAIDALASVLVTEFGIVKGDRVAIGMRNYPEWVLSFAAITSIGAISVSLNAWWTTEEMDYALGDCGAKVLIADRERVERAAGSCARLNIATLAVRLGEANPVTEGRLVRWENVVPQAIAAGATMPEVAIDPDDDATILYTSGTTGFPKGAVSTHRAVTQALMAFGCRSAIDGVRKAANEDPLVPVAPPADPTSFILIVPLFHVTGCVPVMLSCFFAGLKLVIMYKWEPERALQLIERERVTNFVGVPTQSWDLLETPNFAKYDTSSLLAVGGGGAPAPPELVKRVANSFKSGRPQIGYGMTETNAYGPANSGQDYIDKPSSTGKAVPVIRVEVRNDAGAALGPNEIGEIWFNGPNLIRGYWNKPEATAETIVDGWLRSGDLGKTDDDGFIYVVDRAKDMVIRAGENVYCAEVEAAIYEHPSVMEAAVFGVPHERLGEEVGVAVYCKEGHSITVEEVQAITREKLANFKVPSKVWIVSEPLPRNPAGKFLKRELRDTLA
jgi:long-chain acyl-CoA synthetase